jgi:uncharacterized protein YjbJ (UPF0337 family)
MSQAPDEYLAAGTLRQDEPVTVVVEPPAAEAQPSTPDVARDQAAQVKDTATDAAQHVAGVAKEQAGNVAGEAKTQTRNLLDQSRGELLDQASAQQERVASGLRSLEHELHSMAAASSERGIGADLARQAANQAGTVAHWMEGRDPGDLLEEVRSFARQRPAAFLGITAAAGVLAGRLGRGLKDGPTEADIDTSTSGATGRTSPLSTAPVAATSSPSLTAAMTADPERAI